LIASRQRAGNPPGFGDQGQQPAVKRGSRFFTCRPRTIEIQREVHEELDAQQHDDHANGIRGSRFGDGEIATLNSDRDQHHQAGQRVTGQVARSGAEHPPAAHPGHAGGVAREKEGQKAHPADEGHGHPAAIGQAPDFVAQGNTPFPMPTPNSPGDVIAGHQHHRAGQQPAQHPVQPAALDQVGLIFGIEDGRHALGFAAALEFLGLPPLFAHAVPLSIKQGQDRPDDHPAQHPIGHRQYCIGLVDGADNGQNGEEHHLQDGSDNGGQLRAAIGRGGGFSHGSSRIQNENKRRFGELMLRSTR
jgi:hypothetical protein